MINSGREWDWMDKEVGALLSLDRRSPRANSTKRPTLQPLQSIINRIREIWPK